MSREPYESLLEESREGVLVVGEDGVVLYANQAVGELLGLSRGELTGRSLTDPALGLRTLEDRPLSEAESPVALVRNGAFAKMQLLDRHPDGTVAILSITGTPLPSHEGPAGMALEIAQSVRLSAGGAESAMDAPGILDIRRLQALAQMAGLLSSIGTVEEALSQIAEYACILFDLPASLALRADDSSAVHVVASSGLEDAGRALPLDASDLHLLQFDRPVPVVITDLGVLTHLDFFQRLERLGYRSLVSLGLVTDVMSHAVILLLRRESVSLTEEDLIVLRLFGTIAAASVRNAERHETDAHVAQTVQKALLAVPQRTPGVDYAVMYRSATQGALVGGDFYDVFLVPDGRVGVLIGDISGKGLEASLLMAVLKDTVRAYAYTNTSPAEIMGLSNALMLASTPDHIFATAFLALCRPETGEFVYCGAGHPPPFVVRAHGSTCHLEPLSPVLGINQQATYRDASFQLGVGDLVFFYTDGVTETRSGTDFFGEDRLFDLLVRSTAEAPTVDRLDEVIRAVYRGVEQYAGGEFRDDLAMLAFALASPPSPSEA